MSAKAVRQYLERYSEREAGFASRLEGAWEQVVVLPACAEPVELLAALDRAVAGREARVLAILVVNRAEGSSRERGEANQALMDEVRGRGSPVVDLSTDPPMTLASIDPVDWLLVDRSSPGHALPAGEGVGTARKIGCDIALAAVATGRVRGRFIHTTDGDATLPSDYFEAVGRLEGDDRLVAALVYPFRHLRDPSTAFGRALGVYDVSLRYYVQALDGARSPFAFHTIGSTLALCPKKYAAVRGFPRREAGEDFHLLNKLAKVGVIAIPPSEPIEIAERESDRVPFGTGVAAAKIVALGDEDAFSFYDPRIFDAVARWNDILERAVRERGYGDALQRLREPHDEIDAQLAQCVDLRGARRRLDVALAQHDVEDARRRAVFTWFDALRTLQLVHRLRDLVHPSIPWREALRGSRFLGAEASRLSRAPLDEIIEHFERLDAGRPQPVGGIWH